MAITEIQKAFICGVDEIYRTMFTDGVNDGVYFSYLDEESTRVDEVYRESKKKKYKEPILLVGKVNLAPKISEESYFKDIDCDATFSIPLKSLLKHNFDLSSDGLSTLRKGIITFNDRTYKVKNILPTTFVENVFLVYVFVCEEED